MNKDEQVSNLVNKNEAQARTIVFYMEENAKQVKHINEQRAEIAGLENRLTDSLTEWETMKRERGVAKLALSANKKSQEYLVRQIVGVLTDHGYDIAGWGNDSQLEELEHAATEAHEWVDEVRRTLNTIRTDR